MTVAELIEELQKLDPSLEVYHTYYDQGGSCSGWGGGYEEEAIDEVNESQVVGPYTMQKGPRGGKAAMRPTYTTVAMIR